jgi:hypothetical protein
MSINENESILIIQKREELRLISQEIFELISKEVLSLQDITEVRKKLLHVLSLLNIISSHLKTKWDLKELPRFTLKTFDMLEDPNRQKSGKVHAEVLCVVANTIPFSYSRWPSLFKVAIPLLASLELQK